jgi:hypothetical protein
VNAQTDLVKAHLKLLREFYPDNNAVLICEANMSCESFAKRGGISAYILTALQG